MSGPSAIPPQKVKYGTVKSYLIGFVISLVLTLAAYFLATKKLLTGLSLDLSIIFLALMQASLQLLLFFNITRESKPRWKLMSFLFMVMVLLIVVFGSIWIMKSLDYRLM